MKSTIFVLFVVIASLLSSSFAHAEKPGAYWLLDKKYDKFEDRTTGRMNAMNGHGSRWMFIECAPDGSGPQFTAFSETADFSSGQVDGIFIFTANGKDTRVTIDNWWPTSDPRYVILPYEMFDGVLDGIVSSSYFDLRLIDSRGNNHDFYANRNDAQKKFPIVAAGCE